MIDLFGAEEIERKVEDLEKRLEKYEENITDLYIKLSEKESKICTLINEINEYRGILSELNRLFSNPSHNSYTKYGDFASFMDKVDPNSFSNPIHNKIYEIDERLANLEIGK